MASIESDKNPWIVFYDGYCVLCNRFLMFALKRSNAQNLLFSPLDSDLARRRLAHVSADSIVLLADEATYLRSKAAFKILTALGVPWSLFGKLLTFLPTPVCDFFYAGIAATRYKVFGRYDTCPIPPEPIRKRIVSSEDELTASLNSAS